ncbi:hypothetical protein AB0D12_23080 [Streptomyces sp. NPDC048479]|uniref:hypothetical protein n=1 Tax=Streptomyces sp. NPDC048479 TaxID=3154725 RepID=UPI0034348D8C
MSSPPEAYMTAIVSRHHFRTDKAAEAMVLTVESAKDVLDELKTSEFAPFDA